MTALLPLPERPTVSVVIPVGPGSASTLEEAVLAAMQPEVDEVVLAVAPDPTTLATAENLAADDERVRVVPNPTGRTPEALNAAIDAAGGQVIVRVDTHALLPPGYVARALDTLRRTGAANVGGRQAPEAEGGFARAVAAAMTSRAGAGGATYRVGGAEGRADTVYLGVFRREALEDVGGFDPGFTRNQDAELNLRLARAGYLVWFDPQLAVSYRPRGDVASLARQYHGYGRWRRRTAQVHRGSLVPRQLAAPTLVIALAAAAGISAARRDPWLLSMTAAGYGGAVGLAGLAAAPEARLAPRTALALATMHLSWGVGFLQGPPRSACASDPAQSPR